MELEIDYQKENEIQKRERDAFNRSLKSDFFTDNLSFFDPDFLDENGNVLDTVSFFEDCPFMGKN